MFPPLIQCVGQADEQVGGKCSVRLTDGRDVRSEGSSSERLADGGQVRSEDRWKRGQE